MLKLSEQTEAIIEAKAKQIGRTPDELVREVLTRAPDVMPWKRSSAPLPQTLTKEQLIAGMEEISLRSAGRPVVDPQSINEIIGYDDFGLPR